MSKQSFQNFLREMQKISKSIVGNTDNVGMRQNVLHVLLGKLNGLENTFLLGNDKMIVFQGNRISLSEFKVFLLLLPILSTGCLLSTLSQGTSGAELCVRSNCLSLHWLVENWKSSSSGGSLEQADFSSGTIWKLRNSLSLATHKVAKQLRSVSQATVTILC